MEEKKKESTSKELIVQFGNEMLFSCIAKLSPDEDKLISPESKICFFLNNFRAGTGDNAVKVSYNLDLPMFYCLLERVRRAWDKSDFILSPPGRAGYPLTKIFGKNARNQDGSVGASHMRLTRQQFETDANGNQTQKIRMRPWCISIANGTAIPMPGKKKGSFYEKAGSFKKTGEVTIWITDEEMLGICETTASYIRSYESAVAGIVLSNEIREGLKEEKGKTKPQETIQQPAAKKTEGTMDVVIIKNLWPLEGWYKSTFRCRGKDYEFYVAPDVYEACKDLFNESVASGCSIRISIRSEDKALVCTGVIGKV